MMMRARSRSHTFVDPKRANLKTHPVGGTNYMEKNQSWALSRIKPIPSKTEETLFTVLPPSTQPGLVDLLAGLELLEHLEGGLSQVLRNHEKFAAGFLLLGGRPKDSLSLASQDAGPQLRAAELHHQRGRGGRRGRRGRVADAVAGQDSVVDGRSCLEKPVAGSHIQDRAQNSLEHSGVEISRVSRLLLIFRKRKARDPDDGTAEKLLVRVDNGLQRYNLPVERDNIFFKFSHPHLVLPLGGLNLVHGVKNVVDLIVHGELTRDDSRNSFGFGRHCRSREQKFHKDVNKRLS